MCIYLQKQSVLACKQCLESVKKHKIDFILNGGDVVMNISYTKITTKSVVAQWARLDECM